MTNEQPWPAPTPKQLPPPTVQQPSALVQRPRSEKKRNTVVVIGVLAAVVAYVWVSEAYDETKRDRLREANDCPSVGYEISASPAVGFSVTLSNASGNTEQIDRSGGSFTERYSCFLDDFTYISAQIDGTGRITCEITRDGELVARATSNGEFVIATCDD